MSTSHTKFRAWLITARRMASAVVFIFLLDHLPANIPFHPLDISEGPHSEHSVSRIKHCDHIMSSEPILEMISEVLKVKVVPKWRTHDKTHAYAHAKKDIDRETIENFETVLDNSDVDFNNASFEDKQRFIDDNVLENELSDDDKSECDNQNQEINTIDEVKASFPKTAPFLVSIFESLSNVTAQTCGGTLLSPHWVLTVANCVNVLGKLFTNITETSRYTVIANASNPFLDGSVHNVTEIILHPHPQVSTKLHKTPVIKHLAKSTDTKTPVLALMRVVPAINDEFIAIMGQELEENVGVMVYGWQLVKNDTGHDAMHVTSFPATAMTSSKCRRDVTDDICLTDITANNTQISLGGIVVARHNGKPSMLGIAKADEHATYTALPLYKHAAWIHSVLERK